MIDNESPLATVGLSKSDKEIKDIDKIDPNEEVCPFIYCPSFSQSISINLAY